MSDDHSSPSTNQNPTVTKSPTAINSSLNRSAAIFTPNRTSLLNSASLQTSREAQISAPGTLAELLSETTRKHTAEMKALKEELEKRDRIAEAKLNAMKTDFTRTMVKITNRYKNKSGEKDRFGQSFRISDSDSEEGSTRTRVRLGNETLRSTTSTGIDITRIMEDSDSDGVIDNGLESQFRSRRSNDYLKSLSPTHSLSIQLKNSTKAFVTRSPSSLSKWLKYMNALLSACYLECLQCMNPSTEGFPTSAEEWETLDQDKQCVISRADTIRSMGTIPPTLPRPTKKTPITILNGMYLAVAVSWPAIISTLWMNLVGSIDIGLKYLYANKANNETSFRLVYFGVLQHFKLSVIDAGSIKLHAFHDLENPNFQYNVDMDPMEFLTKLENEAEDINALYRQEMVPEGVIRQKFINGLSETSREFDSILTIMGSELPLQKLALKLHDHYRKVRARELMSTSSHGAFAVDAHTGFDDRHRRHKKKQFGREGKKTRLPCFQLRDLGTCSFGDRCKYSHKPEDMNNDIPKKAFAAQIQDLQSSFAAMKESRNHYKSQIRSYRKKREITTARNRKGRKPQSGPESMTYEKALEMANVVNEVSADADEAKETHQDSSDGEVEQNTDDSYSSSSSALRE